MSDKTNIIKISREFKDNVLGSIWLGREITIGYGFDPTEAFIKANEELNEAYRRLSGGNGTMSGVWRETPIYYNGPITGAASGGLNNYIIPTIQVSKKEEALSNFIEAIQTSTTKKGVEAFRKLVERENNPHLTEVFEQTLNKLK